MSRLKPLNPATCTHCSSKNTKRVGYSEVKGGSLWKCYDCGKGFVIPKVVLKKS